MLHTSEPCKFQQCQFDRPIDTIVCSCAAWKSWHCTNLFDTGNTEIQSLRLSKRINSWHLPVAISTNQRRYTDDWFTATNASIALIQIANHLNHWRPLLNRWILLIEPMKRTGQIFHRQQITRTTIARQRRFNRFHFFVVWESQSIKSQWGENSIELNDKRAILFPQMNDNSCANCFNLDEWI